METYFQLPICSRCAIHFKRIVVSEKGPSRETPIKLKRGGELGAGLTPRARKTRIEYAGAAYHVVARGNQGRNVCGDERDRKLWREGL